MLKLMLRAAICLAIPLLLNAQVETQATAILRKNCIPCHSAQAKMGGLILETRAGALQGGASGSPAIVPHAASRSAMLEKINTNKMPPGNPLAAADRQILARWIDEGAPWSAPVISTVQEQIGRASCRERV